MPLQDFYDIALSFAGEDREHARSLATELKRLDVSVFFDEFERGNLLGKDLYAYFMDLYQYRARHAVVFISKDYVRKAWTKVEERAMHARVFHGYEDYIIPIRLDDTDIPAIPNTTGCIHGASTSPANAASLIVDKLRSGPVTPSPVSYPDRIVFGQAVTDWAPLEGGGDIPIRHAFLTTALEQRFVELPEDLRTLRERKLAEFKERTGVEGRTVWNGERYSLTQFHRTRNDVDEETGLHFKFVMTDYAMFQAATKVTVHPPAMHGAGNGGSWPVCRYVRRASAMVRSGSWPRRRSVR